jgi:hypothetical protein
LSAVVSQPSTTNVGLQSTNLELMSDLCNKYTALVRQNMGDFVLDEDPIRTVAPIFADCEHELLKVWERYNAASTDADARTRHRRLQDTWQSVFPLQDMARAILSHRAPARYNADLERAIVQLLAILAQGMISVPSLTFDHASWPGIRGVFNKQQHAVAEGRLRDGDPMLFVAPALVSLGAPKTRPLVRSIDTSP